MKRWMVGLGLTLVLLAALAGCSKGAPKSDQGLLMTPAAGTAPSGGGPAPMTTAPPAKGGIEFAADSGVVYSQISNQIDRMVVRTGNLQLVVRSVPDAVEQVTQLVADLKGYLVSSQKWKEGERDAGNISIRIPSENYNQALASLRGLALEVTSETTSSQDVTQEYVDLGSRLKNLQASESQLLKIMESATKTEEVLNVQRELTIVRGDIEQTKGRMQYLEQTSAMSLITVQLAEAQLVVKINANKVTVKPGENILFNGDVTGGFGPYNYLWDFGDGDTSNARNPSHSFREAGDYTVSLKVADDKGYTNTETRVEYIGVVGGWAIGTTAASAWNGFKAFGRVMADVVTWLAIFSPLWLIIGGIIWWRGHRRRQRVTAKL